MLDYEENPYNPNPVTKLFTTFLFGLTAFHQINILFEWGAVLLLSFIFYKNGFIRDAIKNITSFGLLCLLPNLTVIQSAHFILKMFLMLLLMYRIFYFPVTSGKLLVKTSDVGSVISSMDKLKLPRAVSIPVAVMFRFFPSFREERRNIKLAMKIRGIDFKNPLAYIEHVTVPLLIMSSNISDDISKAAETRCIANPIKKTRYIPLKVKFIDFLYTVLVLAILVGGLLW
ncbi:MAG: energy-coupling factor transporter transmembrane protein EcfT [Ruminococcaceae bacterium]|nr:energy-coupling factor transporter transmembrane protein EcfT [Oscillospiraceae bacterium]